jgi:hypothetical protein
MRTGVWWVRVARIGLVAVGFALMVSSARYFTVTHLDQTAQGTVIGLRRELSTDFRDNNYLVYYQFMTLHKRGAEGTYLLENPARLGDMPRMGSQLQVSYAGADASVNRPWSRDDYDLGQAFMGEFLLVVGAVLTLAGRKLA